MEVNRNHKFSFRSILIMGPDRDRPYSRVHGHFDFLVSVNILYLLVSILIVYMYMSDAK